MPRFDRCTMNTLETRVLSVYSRRNSRGFLALWRSGVIWVRAQPRKKASSIQCLHSRAANRLDDELTRRRSTHQFSRAQEHKQPELNLRINRRRAWSAPRVPTLSMRVRIKTNIARNACATAPTRKYGSCNSVPNANIVCARAAALIPVGAYCKRVFLRRGWRTKNLTPVRWYLKKML